MLFESISQHSNPPPKRGNERKGACLDGATSPLLPSSHLYRSHSQNLVRSHEMMYR